jgi:hypothetical protein
MLWAFVPTQEALHHAVSFGRRCAWVNVLTRGASARPVHVEEACPVPVESRSARARVPPVLLRLDAPGPSAPPFRATAAGLDARPLARPNGATPRALAVARPVFASGAARLARHEPRSVAIGSR